MTDCDSINFIYNTIEEMDWRGTFWLENMPLKVCIIRIIKDSNQKLKFYLRKYSDHETLERYTFYLIISDNRKKHQKAKIMSPYLISKVIF